MLKLMTGRYVICNVEIENQKYTLCNVYTPNQDDPKFLECLCMASDDCAQGNTIIGGISI